MTKLDYEPRKPRRGTHRDNAVSFLLWFVLGGALTTIAGAVLLAVFFAILNGC